MTTSSFSHSEENVGSINHIWERFNPKWELAGVLAGITAGLLALLIAGAVSVKTGGEWSRPFKFIGAAVYGPTATAYGPFNKAATVGLFLHIILCTVYGLLFTHLVSEKSRALSLIILGLVTSYIIWVFSCKLFMPSFDPSLALSLPSFNGLYLHFLFGGTFGILLTIYRSLLKV